MSSAFRRTPSMHYSLLFLLLLSLTPTFVDSQTRSMCLTQLSLTSQACSLLPVSRRHRRFGIVELLRDHNHHHHDHDHNHAHHDHHDDEEEGRGGRQSGHHHHHHHRHHDGKGEGEKGRRNNNRKRRQGSWMEEECCRWLRELDSICVCHVMKRLPRFFLRPHHNLTLSVEGVCHVTYSCLSGY